MPKYRVNTRSYIGNTLVEEGGIVDYDGEPGTNLDPMDSHAERAAKASAKKRALAANGGKAVEPAAPPALVERTGRDLESPFDAANPPPADGEGRRGSHHGEHPNPTAERAGDPQPEVGPTEDQVDGPKATEAAHAATEKAQAAGPKAGPKAGAEKPLA